MVDVVAGHRDAGGELLDPHTAAVELLNVIRPTVAISWFVAFSGHALARWPQYRARLAAGEPGFAQAWAHEVRRFYPFAAFMGGWTPREVEWDGERVPANAMVLLDLYGQNHDPDLWGDPYTFRPERFLGRDIGAFELVPQGGGDPRTGHPLPRRAGRGRRPGRAGGPAGPAAGRRPGAGPVDLAAADPHEAGQRRGAAGPPDRLNGAGRAASRRAGRGDGCHLPVVSSQR